jgi:hypothetical protein
MNRGTLGFVPTQYDSGELPVVAAGALVLTHGLGYTPTVVTLWARCKATDGNFAVGDEVLLPMGGIGTGVGVHRGASLIRTKTHIKIRTGSGGVGYIDPVTGNEANLTLANWRYLVHAE